MEDEYAALLSDRLHDGVLIWLIVVLALFLVELVLNWWFN